jgi:hypothetical protein
MAVLRIDLESEQVKLCGIAGALYCVHAALLTIPTRDQDRARRTLDFHPTFRRQGIRLCCFLGDLGLRQLLAGIETDDRQANDR